MFEKALLELLTSLSQTEIISLLIVIAGVTWYAVQGTLKFTRFIKSNTSSNQQTSLPQNITAQIDQGLKSAIDMLTFKITEVKTSIDSMGTNMMTIAEIENKLNIEFNSIQDKINNIRQEQDKKLTVLSDSVTNIKNSFDNVNRAVSDVEETVNRAISEDKLTHQELTRQIQSISKDLASLQGTIIGNMSMISRSNLR